MIIVNESAHTHIQRERGLWYILLLLEWRETSEKKKLKSRKKKIAKISVAEKWEKNPEKLQLKYVKQECSSSNFKKNIPRIQMWQDEQIENHQNYKEKEKR